MTARPSSAARIAAISAPPHAATAGRKVRSIQPSTARVACHSGAGSWCAGRPAAAPALPAARPCRRPCAMLRRLQGRPVAAPPTARRDRARAGRRRGRDRRRARAAAIRLSWRCRAAPGRSQPAARREARPAGFRPARAARRGSAIPSVRTGSRRVSARRRRFSRRPRCRSRGRCRWHVPAPISRRRAGQCGAGRRATPRNTRRSAAPVRPAHHSCRRGSGAESDGR